MKRSLWAMAGASFLEVLLALSIILLVILLSIRYYQSTRAAHQTEQLMDTISAITAAADNVSLGSADGYSNVTAANMAPVLGSAHMNSPWGEPIRFSSGTATSYTVTIPKPSTAVCTAVESKLKANTKYTNVSCSGGGDLTYTYNSTR